MPDTCKDLTPFGTTRATSASTWPSPSRDFAGASPPQPRFVGAQISAEPPSKPTHLFKSLSLTRRASLFQTRAHPSHQSHKPKEPRTEDHTRSKSRTQTRPKQTETLKPETQDCWSLHFLETKPTMVELKKPPPPGDSDRRQRSFRNLRLWEIKQPLIGYFTASNFHTTASSFQKQSHHRWDLNQSLDKADGRGDEGETTSKQL